MKFRPSVERNRLWLTFVAVVVFAGSLVAQPTAGRLRGLVTDPSGAVIPGASVSVKNASGLAIAVKSDGAGNYDVKNLTPGKYTVSVVAKGFRAAAEEVEVSAGQDKKLDFPLEILAQEEKVEVESEAAKVSVNPDSNASTMIITGKDLDALSDDPDELQSELQALAGPSAGPMAARFTSMVLQAGSFHPNLRSAKFASTRTRSQRNTTAWALDALKSLPSRAPTSPTASFPTMTIIHFSMR